MDPEPRGQRKRDTTRVAIQVCIYWAAYTGADILTYGVDDDSAIGDSCMALGITGWCHMWWHQRLNMFRW